MTDATVDQPEDSPKASKMPVIIGLVLALVGGTGGYIATSQGLIFGPESVKEDVTPEETKVSYSDIAFIPMDPLTISLPGNSEYKHLQFRAELEVASKYKNDVKVIVPRIIDVLNSYLRALEISDIENAASLARLRSQMLRRVQIVAGPGQINDLLIMEFVLN